MLLRERTGSVTAHLLKTSASLRVVGDEACDVFLGCQRGIQELYRRYLFTGDKLGGVFDRIAAHFLRLLGCRHVEDALAERFESRSVAIEAADHDLLRGIRDLDCLSGAKCKAIGLCEDDRDIRICLQHILHDLEAFVLAPDIGILFGDNLHVRIGLEGFAAAFRAIDFRRRALLAMDDDHLPLAAGFLQDVVAHRLGRRDGIGCEECIARRAVGVAIDVDDGNAGVLRKLDRNGRRCRTCRNVDQRVDFLGQKILDLVDLRRPVALRVDRDDFDAALLGFGLDRLLDLVEEVCLKVGNGQAKLLQFRGVYGTEHEAEQCSGREHGARNFHCSSSVV
ncbi:hypothetical protein RHECNPAF_6420037 [Rhizobium etli CNPAF512]|nr:hypothetical protein RHECNPAF_6420037 [Rhizobium etli CNPAF512]